MEEIYILRHGKAEEINESQSKSDFDRKLTEEGKIKTKKLGSLINKIEKELEIILTSPFLRAKETAEIIASSLENKAELKTVDFLSSGTSLQEISKGLISEYSNHKKLMIVGHAPDLEIFLGKLIGAKQIKLKKGALAKVVLNGSIDLSGELEWLITAKLVKDLKNK